MAVRGLLGRLGAKGRQYDPLESIGAHLRALLNSRTGMSLTVPGFGAVDFNDIVHNLPDGIRFLQSALRATIQTYEPRLDNINVRHIRADDSLYLKFEITARLIDDPKRNLRIVSSWHPGGLFTIDSN